jgi:ferredoxin
LQVFKPYGVKERTRMTNKNGVNLGRGRKNRTRTGKSMGRGSGPGIRGGLGMGRRGRRGMTKRRGFRPAPGISFFPESGGTEHEIQVFKTRNETLRYLLRSINTQIAKMEKTETLLPSRRNMKLEKSPIEERKIPGTRAVVDKATCVRCGICADICPEHAIFINGEVMIDSNKCNGCGTCVDECPNKAISLA